MKKQLKHLLKQLKKIQKNAVGYINFGNLFASLGDAEKAEPFFQKAITLDENAATAYYGLANLYYQ